MGNIFCKCLKKSYPLIFHPDPDNNDLLPRSPSIKAAISKLKG